MSGGNFGGAREELYLEGLQKPDFFWPKKKSRIQLFQEVRIKGYRISGLYMGVS